MGLRGVDGIDVNPAPQRAASPSYTSFRWTHHGGTCWRARRKTCLLARLRASSSSSSSSSAQLSSACGWPVGGWDGTWDVEMSGLGVEGGRWPGGIHHIGCGGASAATAHCCRPVASDGILLRTCAAVVLLRHLDPNARERPKTLTSFNRPRPDRLSPPNGRGRLLLLLAPLPVC